MNKLKSWRTLSLIVWIILTAVILATMPDMSRLVKEKGQISIPVSEPSSAAEQMMKQMNADGSETYSIIAVFNSGSNAALVEEQKKKIASVIHDLQSHQEELGIKEIVAHTDSKEVAEQLVSSDHSTILTQISVDQEQGEISEVADSIRTAIGKEDLHALGIDAYLTGSELIGTDFGTSTEEGVKKTEIIAVIFILIVLIIVFRSPIVPLISLLTVGVSYLVSIGVIAQIVDHFSFPFSSFTQVFVVVVLFGVGTDYNILLYTRFKEELAVQDNVLTAVRETMKSAGKTVLYSGLAVMIGFTSLFLATFNLYQATSGVAIGVAVLLLVLITLNPFFMILLGRRMFWPIKKFKGHGENRLWGGLAKNAAGRPFLAAVLVFALTIPFILAYSNVLNFNDLWEVSDKYESKQGINVIEEHFPPGFSAPATLVIQSDQPLDEAGALQTLDELAERISSVEGVSEVMSPTRPTGEKIQELYINDQTKELNSGLDDANNGIGEITEGLSSAGQQIGGSGSSDLESVQQLIDGTSKVQNGVTALHTAMGQVTAGMKSGAAGAEQLQDGLNALNTNVGQLSSAAAGLYTGYDQLAQGLQAYDQYFAGFAEAVNGASQGYQQIEALMDKLIEEKPELADDSNIQQALAVTATAKEQLGELVNQLNLLRSGHQSTLQSFNMANASLAQIKEGLEQVHSGAAQLQTGADQLKTGLKQGANGSEQITDSSLVLESGLTRINNGQEQLLLGLNSLQDKMGELQSGLSASTEGLDQVSSGLATAQSYLNDLSESKTSEKFYIPDEVLQGADFQQAINAYMSEDRRIARMSIILEQNPYSREAMPVIQEINKQVEAALSGTELSGAQAAIGGVTARNADLNSVSQDDFVRTAIIMMIGISFVLLLITRSLTNTVFIAGSLILVYFTSLGIGEWISTQVFNAELLSWNVPFFSFIMIVALGVDYSIFVMMRYNELEGEPSERIIRASRDIGGVILSAALILGGTFAALIPSGVLTLIQVAVVVIIGLVLLSLIAMPVLLPALIGLTGKLGRLE